MMHLIGSGMGRSEMCLALVFVGCEVHMSFNSLQLHLWGSGEVIAGMYCVGGGVFRE